MRLTIAAQVYGGSLSLVIGAYLWSSVDTILHDATCSAGGTVVSGLSMELSNIRISGSQAGTYTINGALKAQNHTFLMRKRFGTLLIVLTPFELRHFVRLQRTLCAVMITCALVVLM